MERMDVPGNSDSQAAPVVLAIDDSPDVHRLLMARLRGERMTLHCEGSGSAGVEWAVRHRPAIVLLDLDMPDMDGFEVLRVLKENPETVGIPVIVLSGLAGTQDKVTAFDLGAVDYITKPFDLTELRVRVRSALRLHGLMAMLAQKAQIDGLTGLWNRSHFDQRWGEETATSLRHGRALSIMIVDVDHFKSINDTFGHPTGDVVLQDVATLIQRASRQSDIPCRYGGEEFTVILPDTGPADAVNLAERVRKAIEGADWSRLGGRRLTASIGVAGIASGSTGQRAPSASAWLEAADQNLYAAKQAGRNRVVASDLGRPPLRLAETA